MIAEKLFVNGARFMMRVFASFNAPIQWLSTVIIALCGYFLAPSVAVAGMNFSFILSGSCTTSAGVYDTNDHLVKTLWRKRIYTSGTNVQDAWDGTKDDGFSAPDGKYQIRLLYNINPGTKIERLRRRILL
jgi:hypothetical protein